MQVTVPALHCILDAKRTFQDTVRSVEFRFGREDDRTETSVSFPPLIARSTLAGAMGHGTGHPSAEAGLAWCVSVQA